MTATAIPEMLKEALVVTDVINPLPVTDQCDECGARAWGRAVLREGGALLFCAHHLRQHFDVLVARSVKVEDYTSALAKQEAH